MLLLCLLHKHSSLQSMQGLSDSRRSFMLFRHQHYRTACDACAGLLTAALHCVVAARGLNASLRLK
jgi:hypothetical protein